MAKILLVEDDKSLREIYGVRLQAEGYEIVSAGDGEEALALAIKERPELIVSDVMMPKISGFDMLDILRSTTETKDVKVIMMTALSSEDQRARGESLGADRYLVKSQVGIEDVVRTVHEVLADNGASPAPAPIAAPTPSPVAEPVTMPVEPTAPVATDPMLAPQPAPLPPAPAAPASAPEPITAPVAAAPAPIASTLPQPTAPFSSPAPSSLGDQVREAAAAPVYDPSANTGNTPLDLSAQMAAELGTPAVAAPASPAPVPAPIDTPALQSADDIVMPDPEEPTGIAPEAPQPASQPVAQPAFNPSAPPQATSVTDPMIVTPSVVPTELPVAPLEQPVAPTPPPMPPAAV